MNEKLKEVKLRKIREDAGMTKAELARKTGMQAGTIGWIEEGRFIPYDSQLSKIAEVLDVDNPEILLERVI